MKLSKKIKLSNQILDNEPDRYCVIYKITNLINNKIYIGQAVSHILNHNRYRPHGMNGRFRCHISEAYSTKTNQSQYLNNAIKKYNQTNFIVELIENCEIKDADTLEQYYIKNSNSLYPNGYNLNSGGNTFQHTNESKKRVSIGVMNYYENKKFDRFMKLSRNINENDFPKYIKPLNRNKQQYGWYIYIDGIKADFGGVHISLEDSKKYAINFMTELKNKLAKYLDAGNSLEPLITTPNVETQLEELG
jgi:group I intron endonuclease